MGFQVFLLLQHLAGMAQALDRVALVFVERQGGGLGGIEQGLRIGQPAVFGIERGPLVGRRCQLVEFANLPAQALAFAQQRVPRGARLFQLVLCCTPLLPFSRIAGTMLWLSTGLSAASGFFAM